MITLNRTAAYSFIAAPFLTGTVSAAPAEATQKLTPGLQAHPGDVDVMANKDLLALNAGMFSLYGNSHNAFQQKFLENHPLILALFSTGGGEMVLYRPGQSPEKAPPVPIVYQLLKSTGHSTLAISQVALPFAGKKENSSWKMPLTDYRNDIQRAVDGLDDITMDVSWKGTVRSILQNNINYINLCLQKGEITSTDLEAFWKKQGPLLKLIIGWAAQTQVNHWMTVLDKWKTDLGPEWDKTYAASNTIYVARQNNILFSVLAQFFGPQAINDRLFLIETISFTTTLGDMLSAVTRIVSDRNAGQIFFGNDRVMDYELMGGDARKAIIAEMKKRGKAPVLTPLVSFGSKQWPALITPGAGPKTLSDL